MFFPLSCQKRRGGGVARAVQHMMWVSSRETTAVSGEEEVTEGPHTVFPS